MQPQEMPVSDFFILTKPTARKILASSYLATDPPSGLDSKGTIAQGFRVPSNNDPHISRLLKQTQLYTPLSCDIEPDITKPTPRKIFSSSDLATDTSAGLDSEGAIAQGFRGPSNHDPHILRL